MLRQLTQNISSFFRPAQRKDDFSVTVIDMDWTEEQCTLISQQTERIEFSLTHEELTLWVRQVKGGAIQNLILHILEREHRSIDLIEVTPLLSYAYTLVFENGELSDHHVEMDRRGTGPMLHRLDFTFARVTSIDPRRGSVVLPRQEKPQRLFG